MAFQIFDLAFNGSWALAWLFYISLDIITEKVRTQVREALEMQGNLFDDFLLSFVIYPAMGLKMDMERTDVTIPPSRNIKNNVINQGDVKINNACKFYFQNGG